MSGSTSHRRPLLRSSMSVAVLAALTGTFPLSAYAANDEAVKLDAVEVTAKSVRVERTGSLGVLGSADVMDAPFNTSSYTSRMLEDQQARTLADVVVNEASVRVMTSTGSFSEDFQIRGFNVTSGDVGLNGLYGLTSSNRMPAAMMERVEVLKGPGTLMYGISPNGSIGGNINIVTKRAGDDPLDRVTATYESKSVFGTHLDIGRRFGADKQWGVRFNGVYRTGQTSLDDGRQKLGLGAIGVDYRSLNLRWSLDAYAQRENVDTFRAQTGFSPDNTTIPKPPSGHTAIYEGADLMSRDQAISTRLEFDTSDNFMVYAAGGYRYGNTEQDFPSARGFDAVDDEGNLRITNAWYDAESHNRTGEVGARAKFDTFGVRHFATASASMLKSEAGSFYLGAPAGQYVDSNIYNPVRPIPMTGVRLSPTKNSETELGSISLTDTLSFAGDRFLVTAGVRKQNVKVENFNAAGAVTSSYDESAVSPLYGVVYRPMQHLSLYANMTSGLSRGGTAPATASNAGEVFEPYKSKQYEAGVKLDRANLITTFSVFQIGRPNALTNPLTNHYSFDGQQRNRGFEIATAGEVLPGLNILASATIYDAELRKTAGGVNQGNDANGVPSHTINLGADWELRSVPGLALNARGIYTAATPYNVENTQTLPSWTRIDIGGRYSTRMAGTPVVLRASIENVFDDRYWLSSSTLLTVGTVAAPRTVLLSAQFDF